MALQRTFLLLRRSFARVIWFICVLYAMYSQDLDVFAVLFPLYDSMCTAEAFRLEHNSRFLCQVSARTSATGRPHPDRFPWTAQLTSYSCARSGLGRHPVRQPRHRRRRLRRQSAIAVDDELRVFLYDDHSRHGFCVGYGSDNQDEWRRSFKWIFAYEPGAGWLQTKVVA